MSGVKAFFNKFTSKLDQTPSDVPMGKRLGAYFVDWALGGIICGFPAVLIYGSITGKSDMFSNLYVFEALGFEAYWGILAGVLCIVMALAYYVFIPWKIWGGQTCGKRLTGLRIVSKDGSLATLKQLLLRQVFTIFLLEGSMYVITGYIRQLFTLLTRFYVDAIWQYIGIAVTLISAILVIYTASHRALHDYIAGTKVVLAPKEEEKKDREIPSSNNPTVKNTKPQKMTEKDRKPQKATEKDRKPQPKVPVEKKRLPKKNKTKR